MTTKSTPLCTLVALCLCAVAVFSIIVPEDATNRKTLKTIGIKTLGWQANGGRSPEAGVQMHHNYSKVHNVNYPNGTAAQSYSGAYQGSAHVRAGENAVNDHLSNFEDQQSTAEQHATVQRSRYAVNDHLSDFVGQQIGDSATNDHLSGFIGQQIDGSATNDHLPGFIEQQIQGSAINDHLSGFADQSTNFGRTAYRTNFSRQYYGPQRTQHPDDERPFTNAHSSYEGRPERLTHIQVGRHKSRNPYFEKQIRPEAHKKCPKLATGQFVYELSCNQFLNCWKGRGFVQNCAPGTLFNPKTLECDFPEKVGCMTGPRQTPLERREPLSAALQATCPAGFSGIIPHYTDCSKFMNCADGVEVAMDCPPGTLFDTRTNLCDFPHKTDCADGRSRDDGQSRYGRDDAAAHGAAQDSRFHHGYTNQYVLQPYRKNRHSTNVEGSTSAQVNDHLEGFSSANVHDQLGGLPHSGHPINDHLGGFAYDSSSASQNQWNQYTSAAEIRSLGLDNSYCTRSPRFSAHPSNCTKFLYCENGRLSIGVCQKPSAYNPTKNACDSSYQCRWSASGQSGGAQVNSQGQNARNYEQASISARPKCPPDFSGLLPHPTDCTKFLNCDHGGTFVQDCGPGTHFNPQLKVCDFPYRAGCESRTQTSQSTTQAPWHVHQQPPSGGGSQWSGANRQTFDQYQTSASTNQQQKWHGQGQGQISATNQQQTGQWPEPGRQNLDHHQTSASTDQQQQWHGQGQGQTTTQNQQQQWQGQGEEQTSATNQQQTGQWPGPGRQNLDHHQTPASANQHQLWHGQGQTSGANQQQTGRDHDEIEQWTNLNNEWQQYGENRDRQRQRLNQQWTSQVQDQLPNKRNWINQYQRHSESSQSSNKHGPPPFPTTDPNADYVFEYEDLNEIDVPTRKVKNVCETNDFYCSSTVCISQAMVCDNVQDCPNGKDETNCEKYVEQFALTSGTKLAVREKQKFSNVTATLCAKYCMESRNFQCKSFNYRKNDGTCYLIDSNVGLLGGLFLLANYDYYEYRKFTVDCSAKYECGSRKCIDLAQLCDGVDDCGDRADEKGCKAQQIGYSVRLFGSPNAHEGIVEVSAFGKAGYVCDDMFGLRNAHVLCKELGYGLGALETRGTSYFTPGTRFTNTFYMMDDVSCLGNETSLRDCDFNGWGVHNCMDEEIVGVVCKTPQEKCPNNYWRCETGNDCLPLPFVCDGVYDCDDRSDEGSQYCESPLEMRLAGGSTKKEGRIEIKHHGIWGTICDDDFNDDAAKVACRYLGYKGSAYVRKDGYFGPGEGPIWLDQVYCQGNESSIEDCSHWDWNEHNCEHSEDVGVVCSDYGISETPRSSKQMPPPVLFPERCGYRSDNIFAPDDGVHFRVVQGAVAKTGHYPWQASLRVRGKTKPSHWCGAVVISQRFVLTAAHCLDGFTKGAYVVVAGDYDVDVDEGTEQSAYIDNFYIHERFRSGTRMNNDIALVKVKGDGFNVTEAVQPICLPAADYAGEEGLNCTISGFGSIRSGKAVASKQLRAGWVPIQPAEVCKMAHVYGEAITEGMLCAGSLDEGVDACDGDSGGPLACLHDGLFTLIGLTSWGQHCGYANKPGVYVKIAHYREWIDATMKKHN